MRETIFCKHFRSMLDYATCEAGISYDTLRGLPHDQRPCFCRKGFAPGGCDKAVFPTAEEVAAKDAEFEKLFQRTAIARNAIVSHLGGPWKHGMPGSNGAIDCPVCNGPSSLRFSRSGYNGHIHAQCTTEGCVAWME